MPPSGVKIDDGFPTLITFSSTPNTSFWEKEVTPPGASAGGANNTTTMRNIRYRTKAPKKLIEFTDSSGVAAYDPKVYNDIDDQLGVNQLITIDFPDDSKVAFWGWLDETRPNRNVEGEQPTINFTIICSNQDGSGNEVAPVYTPPPP